MRGVDSHSSVPSTQVHVVGVERWAPGKDTSRCDCATYPAGVDRVQLPVGLAASLEAQEILGSGVRVVAAFQNVSAEHMNVDGSVIDCDVLVCGDDSGARSEVIRLVQAIGMSGLHAGPLANAVAIESLTPVLIGMKTR